MSSTLYWFYCDEQLEGRRKPVHIVGKDSVLQTTDQVHWGPLKLTITSLLQEQFEDFYHLTY